MNGSYFIFESHFLAVCHSYIIRKKVRKYRLDGMWTVTGNSSLASVPFQMREIIPSYAETIMSRGGSPRTRKHFVEDDIAAYAETRTIASVPTCNVNNRSMLNLEDSFVKTGGQQKSMEFLKSNIFPHIEWLYKSLFEILSKIAYRQKPSPNSYPTHHATSCAQTFRLISYNFIIHYLFIILCYSSTNFEGRTKWRN